MQRLSALILAVFVLFLPGITLADSNPGVKTSPSSFSDPRTFETDIRLLRGYARGRIAAGENLTRVTPGPWLDLRTDMGNPGGVLLGFDLAGRVSGDGRVSFRLLEGTLASESTVSRSFSYDDVYILAGSPARTEVTFHHRELVWEQRLGRGREDSLWAGAGLGYYNFDSGFPRVAGGLGAGDKDDVFALLLILRLKGELSLAPSLALAGEVTAGVLPIEAVLAEPADADYFSLRCGLTWCLSPSLEAAVGVDYLRVRARFAGEEKDHDFGDNRIDLDLLAPSLGIKMNW